MSTVDVALESLSGSIDIADLKSITFEQYQEMYQKQEQQKKAKESPSLLEQKRDPALEFEYKVIELTEKWANQAWEEPQPTEPEIDPAAEKKEPEDKMKIFISSIVDPKSPSEYKTIK